ncbi:MAG: response regulator transcription factor [Bacteroidia bacterium]|nr:response regulator transcription factor [Bacteroidia bacterium]
MSTSPKLRAVMVEDEQASRETLRRYLEKYCPQVEVVGEGTTVKEGITVIRELRPDLVFLDVEMPYGNAFDLLEEVGDLGFEAIFITAYSHYAMKALNFSAVYYILKPIDIDELITAVERAAEARNKHEGNFKTRILMENMQTEQFQNRKVVLPVLDGFEVVKVKDVIRCQGNGNFTDFYLADGSKRVICRTLKFYDELLTECDFLRVHRSHLINLQYVKGYKKGKGGQVIMSDGTAVEVAPARKDELLARF